MVSNAYQRKIAHRAMAQVEVIAAVGSEVYDWFEDERIAAASKALATALIEFREAVRLYSIRNELAG